jgi:hypothetical protein
MPNRAVYLSWEHFMKKIIRVLALISVTLLMLSNGACQVSEASPSEFVLVVPETSDDVLINPGKGWILYDDGNGSFLNQSDLAWQYASLGYSRFRWADIELSDRMYDWSMVDFALNQCKAAGKTFAFGVMASDPTSTRDYCTPEFIHTMPDVHSLVLSVPNYGLPDPQKPGQYTRMKKHEIDFTNPGEGYYRKVEEFAQALATRYGGDPSIEYIDIRPFGSWGENTHAWLYGSEEEGYDAGICDDRRHDQGVVSEVMIRCWDAYLQAFQGTGTQLMTAWGYGCNGCMSYTNKEPFYWAAEHGIGIRRDGYSVRTSCGGREVLWSLNKAATALEIPNSYTWQATNTGYGAADLLVSPELNRASYYPIGTYGRDSSTMLNQIREAVDAVTNRIGYHFVLTSVSFPESLGIGEDAAISMKWLNDGTSKLFRTAHVAAALLDREGRVADLCWLDRTDPREWVCAMDFLTADRTNPEVDTLLFEKADPDGGYRLAIGLFTSKDKAEPDIRIGNGGRTAENWYVVYDRAIGALRRTDLSVVATVTASSWLEGHEPASALQFQDGYWTSDGQEEAWIQLDLGSVQTVSGMDIRWGRHYAGRFLVQGAEHADGPFDEVYESAVGTAPEDQIGFHPTKARYLRIVCLDDGVQEGEPQELVPLKGRNLLENPEFRDGLAGWRDYDDAHMRIVMDVKNSGASMVEFFGRTMHTMRQSLTSMLELTGPGDYVISLEALSEGEGTVVEMELGVKGSDHDQTLVPFWDAQTKYRYTSEELPRNSRTRIEFPITVAYDGLIDLGYLRITATTSEQATVRIGQVSLRKTSDIIGERESLVNPLEGRYTILSLRVY